jgi:outer membrane receptor protein involved in Fe transport
MNQLAPNPSIVSFTGAFIDPRRGNETTGTVRAITGGDPNLRPETSRTKTAGLVVTPSFVPGLRLAADWTRLAKRDNITTPGTQELINLESTFPSRIERGPVPAGDRYGVGPITAVNFSPINLAKAELEFYDFQADYQKKTANWGTFDFFAAASRAMHFKTQILPTSPMVENVGSTSGGGALTASSQRNFPIKWKGNAGVT